MSSLAAARADNFYYPPGWDPSKGSLNTYHGQHPLRERARKLDQGILIIRFEMPFNVWCLKCSSHIGKGVRYNAEKKAVGKYFSTKIWQFTMRCHLCSNKIVVTTDPKNHEYLMTEGARRKIESYTAEDAETYEFMDKETREAIASDPMSKLEHTQKDKKSAKQKKTVLTSLTELQDRMKDDFHWSRVMRRKFRVKKKDLKRELEDAKAKNFDYRLLPVTDDDQRQAHAVEFAPSTSSRQHRRLKRLKINKESIFDKKSLSRGDSKRAKQLRTLTKTLKLGMDPKLLGDAVKAASSTIRRPSHAPPVAPAAQSPVSSVVVKATRSNGPDKDKRKSKKKRKRKRKKAADVSSLALLGSYSDSDD